MTHLNRGREPLLWRPSCVRGLHHQGVGAACLAVQLAPGDDRPVGVDVKGTVLIARCDRVLDAAVVTCV